MRIHSFVALMIVGFRDAFGAPGGLAGKADLLGAQADPGAGGVGFVALLQMFVALGIVLAVLKWALPKFAAAFNRRLSPSLGGSIKIEESAAFAGGNLYVVSVRDRQLLLSVSQSGVSCLADLGERADAAEAPAFGEMLESAKAAPARAAVEVPGEAEEPDPAAVAEALRRLERLAG